MSEQKRVLLYTTLYDVGPEYINLPYAEHTVAINTAYAKRHNYVFENVDVPSDFPDRPKAWLRVWYARKFIKDYDYIMFLDGDAFFVDHSRNLDHLIDKYLGGETCFVFARDQKLENHVFHQNRPNAGVFLIKNSEAACTLLDSWWNVPDEDYNGKLFYDANRYLDTQDTVYHHPYEQLALWFVYDANLAAFCLTDDYKELNGLDGEFVRHLIQVPDSVRLRATKEFYKTLTQ